MFDKTPTKGRARLPVDAAAAKLDPALASQSVAARILGVTRQRVWQLDKDGALKPFAHFGSSGVFYRREAVEALHAKRLAQAEQQVLASSVLVS